MASATKYNASIPTAVDGCGRSFLSLAESLRSPSRFADQVASEAILDEFDRFKLWAGNIAAHRKGRRSLEHRLRDASQLKAETLSLLTSLSKALNHAISIVKEHRLPWDEETFSDSDSDSESADSRSEHDLQGDTELKQLFASMRSLITSLMRLSMAIREPAPDRQVRSIDKSHFEQHDMGHVQAKFPDIPQYLAERLGRAISSRRQYLTYREVHHEKLSKGIDKLGLEAARTEFTTNSTEATRLQQNDKVTMMDDGDDTCSMTSYATSVNATLRAPGLPKEAREKEYYNCPLCHVLISIHTTAAWKRHVYQDLHPYCCTFEDCTTADRLYDSRHTWFAHESEAHYSTFQCVEGCFRTFQTETEFETHVNSSHANMAVPEIYSALKRTSTRGLSMSETVHCRLCRKSMILRAMQKHMGHHHEQLALFALPPTFDDTEEDQEELSSMSNSDDVGHEEEKVEMSDINDGSESNGISDDYLLQRDFTISGPETDAFEGQIPVLTPQSVPKSAVGGSTQSISWSAQDDEALIQARTQGLSWNQIAPKYFPEKTTNACRKRYERLMERNLQQQEDYLQVSSIENTKAGKERERTEDSSEDSEDNSQARRYKHNSRIGNLFATHQAELQQHLVGSDLIGIEPDASDSDVTNEQQSAEEKNTGAQWTPIRCQHSFKGIRSDTSVVVWNCNMCHSGPHSLIYECSNCKLQTCRSCVSKASDAITTQRTVHLSNDPGVALFPSRGKNSGDRFKAGAASEKQEESTGSASEVEVTETHVMPSNQSSIQNRQGLNVQIPVDIQGKDNPESPSTNRYKCPYCSADFTRQHNLKSHMLTHSQEKPYECPTCQARFRRQFDLNRHTKLHASESPHTCLKCGRKFARSNTLARHNKAGCAGRQSSVGIDEDKVDGKVNEGMDGAVYTNEPDEGYEDNDDGESSKDTVHPLHGRSPEDAELMKERERLIRENKQMNYLEKMEKSGREDEAGEIAEKEESLVEEHQPVIDEYEQKKSQEEKRVDEERKRIIIEYEQKKKLEVLGRENEAGSEGETSKDMSHGLEGTSIDAGLQKDAKSSHEYERFKQQTGLPSDLVAGLTAGPNTKSSITPKEFEEFTREQSKTKIEKAPIGHRSSDFTVSAAGGSAQSSSWSAQDDETLIQARTRGLAWNQIAPKHFPHKSPNACRKRHEHLMVRTATENRAKEKAEKEREEKELEESMRKRLKQFGFEDNQISSMIDQQQQKESEAESGPSSDNPVRIASQPTYAKVNKEHLATETLEYYDIPYEYDATDPNYIIVLRELTQKEADVLFEHTRRLRKGKADFFESGADVRGRRRASDGASNVTVSDSTSETDNPKTGNVPNRDYILDLADPSRSSNPGDYPNPERKQKHPATFQCTLCPERFTGAYDLRMHLRTHTDERPFVCSVCGKAFARQHDRKQHEDLHSGTPGAEVHGSRRTSGGTFNTIVNDFASEMDSLNTAASDEQSPQQQSMSVVPHTKEEKEPSRMEYSDANLTTHKPAKDEYP